jgi:hypothetical protein
MPVMNRVTGGQSVPVIFSLGGNKGLNIMAPGYPVSQSIACTGAASFDDIEQTEAPGASALTYDVATDRYKYSWKTEKAWKNTCRQLTVKLSDGTTHAATFQLK